MNPIFDLLHSHEINCTWHPILMEWAIANIGFATGMAFLLYNLWEAEDDGEPYPLLRVFVVPSGGLSFVCPPMWSCWFPRFQGQNEQG